MNEYKTIDQLLNENSNLQYAVSILLSGLIKPKDAYTSLYKWDEFRRNEKSD